MASEAGATVSPSPSPSPSILDVLDVVSAATAATERLFAASQVDRKLVMAPGLAPIFGSGSLLQAILVKLIASAIRFGDGGRVTVAAAQFGSRVELSVSHGGVPVSSAEKQRSLAGLSGVADGWDEWVAQLELTGGSIWIAQSHEMDEVVTTVSVGVAAVEPVLVGSPDRETSRQQRNKGLEQEHE